MLPPTWQQTLYSQTSQVSRFVAIHVNYKIMRDSETTCFLAHVHAVSVYHALGPWDEASKMHACAEIVAKVVLCGHVYK